MKVKAIVKDRMITFLQPIRLKQDEMEIELDIPDDMVEIIDEKELESMSLDELTDFIWGGIEVSEEDIKHLNKDYKELLMEALSERVAE